MNLNAIKSNLGNASSSRTDSVGESSEDSTQLGDFMNISDSFAVQLLETLAQRSDANAVFEHYSTFDSSNIDFLLSDVGSFANELTEFISSQASTDGTFDVSSLGSFFKFFDNLFSQIDQKYSTEFRGILKNFESEFTELLNNETEQSKSSWLSSIEELFSDMKDELSSGKAQKLNSNLNDKMNLYYLFDRLANFSEKSDPTGALPEILKKQIESEFANNNITKYISISSKTNDDVLASYQIANLNNKTIVPIDETSGITTDTKMSESILKSALSNENTNAEVEIISDENETIGDESSKIEGLKLSNFSQSGEFNEPQDNQSSNLTTSNLAFAQIFKNISKSGKEFAISEENGELKYNQVFKNVSLQEFPKLTSGFIRNLPRETGGEARMLLQPASLGTVIVEIKMKGNVADITLKTDTQDALRSIESSFAALRTNLQSQGIEIGKFELNLNDNQSFAQADNSGNRSSGESDERRRFLESFKNLGKNEQFENENKTENLRFLAGKLIEKYV